MGKRCPSTGRRILSGAGGGMHPRNVILPFQIPPAPGEGGTGSSTDEPLKASIWPALLASESSPRFQRGFLVLPNPQHKVIPWPGASALGPVRGRAFAEVRGEGDHPELQNPGQPEPPDPSWGMEPAGARWAGQKPSPDVARTMPRGARGPAGLWEEGNPNRARRTSIQNPAIPEVRKRRVTRAVEPGQRLWHPQGGRCPREQRVK